MIIETEGVRNRYNEEWEYVIKSVDDFYNNKSFKEIERIVKDHCNCDGIELDSEISYKQSCYKPESWYVVHDGYIYHQSCEEYICLQDFLDDYGTNIEDFIFNENVVLITDNDNH